MTYKIGGTHLKVYDAILKDKDMNSTDKLLLSKIISLSENGICFASKQWLADYLGLEVRTIFNSLDRLERWGLIYRRDIHILNEGDEEGDKKQSIIFPTNRVLGIDAPYQSVESMLYNGNEIVFLDDNQEELLVIER